MLNIDVFSSYYYYYYYCYVLFKRLEGKAKASGLSDEVVNKVYFNSDS